MKPVEANFKKRIFEYSDYREFLLDYVREKQTQSAGFTLSRFAKKLKLKSPSSINKILKGQRHPSVGLAIELAHYFGMTHEQSRYFQDLVLGKKNVQGLLPKSFRQPGAVRVLSNADWEKISKWYFYAIREMQKLKNFQSDPKWIQKRLNFGVEAYQIESALQILSALNLNQQTHVHTQTEVPSEALKKFHEQMIEFAKVAIRKVPISDRYIVGSTLTIRKEKLSLAKTLIEQLQDALADQCEAQDGDEVYQLNVQFFPLTGGPYEK